MSFDARPTRYVFRPESDFESDASPRAQDPFMPIVEWRGGNRWAIHQGNWRPIRVWDESSKEWVYEEGYEPSESTRYSLIDALIIGQRLADERNEEIAEQKAKQHEHR